MQPQPFPYIVPKCEQAITTLYEDDDILVISKPEFLLSQPGKHPDNHDSVLSRLQPNHPDIALVHRLDLDTSGIMVVPLHKTACAHIARQFQLRQIHKTYTAVLWGLLEHDQGTLDYPIAKDWQHPPLQKICYETGKSSITKYRVLSRNKQENSTRVALDLLTGRTHQLRIHTRTFGHPIIGCDLYATDEAFHMSPRLMLHATELGFRHPETEEPMEFLSPVPF
ncbi:Ribosomal large subunit pseudouridine synthase A [BD1-7 clade bacterium]|uniref:Ribosomal large subunit pseudouridine synthase A n=1 Tax=BD1-7 clade bacterium TaxID=2029982 RepID=A0A5S9N4P0_9GAMM|nr:Ribosomal large subunit pseudouridine synthase A [BD1-7 clade bacterium]